MPNKKNVSNKNPDKYYTAFNYLDVKPLFKSKIFEFVKYDIEHALNVCQEELEMISELHQISFPKNILKKIDELDIDKCYENAFRIEGIKLLKYEDEKYPPLLKQIPDFPLSLFYKGNLDNIDNICNLAVVGSRKASMNAKISLDSIISSLANSNITIVSGLAFGIDAQAHKSAMESNLKTVGVVGSGLDTVYPIQNKYLYDRIINSYGIVMSEYPLGVGPLPRNFPQRNRIVTGMSKGTLVAEAQIHSGAMISANLTLDYNRELMCMPGPINNPNTHGIYQLIKNGASIVTCAQDLIDNMGWEIKLQDDDCKISELTAQEKQVLDIISIEEKTFDEIINELKCNSSSLMVTLTNLEIKSFVIQKNGKYYKN